MTRPSRNICLMTDTDRLPFIYRAECDCVGDHGTTLFLEVDEDGTLSLMLYADLDYSEYWCRGWWETLWRRIRTAWGILVHGRQDGISTEFIFAGEEGVRSYLAALEAGLAEATLRRIEEEAQ